MGNRTAQVISVTTIRASLPRTHDFVAHLKDQGVGRIFLFFDDPGDPAFEYFADDHDVIAYRCDEAYWDHLRGGDRPKLVFERQACNATMVFRMLLDAGIDDGWILHLDEDERLFTWRTLPTLLAAVPRSCNAVRFATAEAVPEALYPESADHELTLFRRPVEAPLRVNPTSSLRLFWQALSLALVVTFRARRRLAKYLGCTSVFEYGFFRGHPYGKCATRVCSKIESISVHKPKTWSVDDDAPCVCHEGWLLHYDCISLEEWRRKWSRRRGGVPNQHRREPRTEQLEKYGEAAESSDPHAFEHAYWDIYYMNAYQKCLLRIMGFLVRFRPGVVPRIQTR